VTDERSPYELTRAIDRIEADVRQIRQDYLLREVFTSEHRAYGERILRLEQNDTSRTSGNRTWLLNLVGIILGVAASGIVTVLIARGGH
jgi:hypothetical protein